MTFLAFLALVHPAIDEPIEFKAIVGTAPTVLQKLSEKTGQKITFNKNVANDVVGICAPKATARQIMDQIAFTLQAEWKEQGGEWTLYRSDAQIKAQAELNRKERIDQIKRSLDRLPADKPWTSGDAKAVAAQINTFERQAQNGGNFVGRGYQDVQAKMPANRLLIRALRALKPETIADIPKPTRMVYSSAPNRMQRALPAALGADLQQFAQESNDLRTAWIPSDNQNGIFFPQPNEVKKVAWVIVSVKYETLGGIRAELNAYDEKGLSVGQAMQTLNLDLPSEQFKPEPVKSGDKLVDLQPLSKRLLDFAKLSMGSRAFLPSPEVRDFLYRPKQNEPLSLLNSELIEALSNDEGKPVALSLPEIQIFVMLSLAQDGRVSLNRYKSSLQLSGIKREEKDGWICYRETNPELGRTRRVDRQAFDDYFRRIERDKRQTLDGFAEMVLRYPGRLEDTMFPIFLMLTGIYPENLQYGDDLSAVRLYGSLNGAQRDALRKGAKLALGDFSTGQQQVLHQLVFNRVNRNVSFSIESEDGPGRDFHRSALNEPTIAFPNGLSDPFEVSAEVSDSRSWFQKQSWGAVQPVDTNTMAWHIFQKERLDLFPYMATTNQGEDGGYAEGHQRAWEFKFRMTKNSSIIERLSDHTYPDGAFTKFAQLPKELRDQIDKRVAQLREQYKDTKSGEFGQGRGAPPPKLL